MNFVDNDRRDLLKKSGIIATSSILLPNEIFAKSSNKSNRLNLYNAHIRKTFRPRLYDKSGKLDIMGLFELDKAMMDYRQLEITRTNFKLANLLYRINSYIGFNKRIVIHSGYRTRRTNNMLRRYSKGVAKRSYHLKGMAVDITVEGMRLSKIKDIVKGINSRGGMGYYPNSGFIHIDSGPKRAWTSYS
jgi:uncharacterized protein YcbK (DUF882 family)